VSGKVEVFDVWDSRPLAGRPIAELLRQSVAQLPDSSNSEALGAEENARKSIAAVKANPSDAYAQINLGIVRLTLRLDQGLRKRCKDRPSGQRLPANQGHAKRLQRSQTRENSSHCDGRWVRQSPWARDIHCEFTAPTEDVHRASAEFLRQVCGPLTVLRFNDLHTGNTVEMTYQDFDAQLKGT
jgi:hypothetical protein